MPIAMDISQMVDAADVVVVGRYISFDSSWNMARNPNNIHLEDNDNFTEGFLFNFLVDEVIVGDIAKGEIIVNHRVSETVKIIESDAQINDVGIIISRATVEEEISFSVNDPHYIEPEFGVSYMLFLRKNEIFGHYYRAIEPFSMVIAPDRTVRLQSNLINNLGNFYKIVSINGDRTIDVTISSGVSIEDNISYNSLDNVIQQVRLHASSMN